MTSPTRAAPAPAKAPAPAPAQTPAQAPAPAPVPEAPAAGAALHQPVLAARCLELLAPALAAPGSVLVDGTLGLGGHAELLLAELPQVTVVGIDRDPQALALATNRLRRFASRFIPARANYSQVAEVLRANGFTAAQGVLLDLGVSSLQLDVDERGFTYLRDAPLDMRMDQTGGITAAEVLNQYNAEALAKVFGDYGEERFARRIAERVVERRQRQPFARSGELVEVVQHAVPRQAQKGRGHVAKQVYQALRIEVNDELGGLRRAVPAALAALAVGGRLVVEAYQSLEDRIVKQALAPGLRGTTPEGVPVIVEAERPYLRALTRGAEQAGPAEVLENPRAASVRLRAVERIR